ncbi:hypothetical protein [Rhodococcus sp. IEGM 1408]|uniref:hypothetical protein n=1 Tax=Rhodococcus sp. IEGM 1408 TaxID=3082220 RepID=UPI002952AE7D|nr:hypothetical protein [Rhodococcus sp. IEGM 1408]MDV8000382.1 hypothetical protein [Rhodococcus sp. IEGM 1408]
MPSNRPKASPATLSLAGRRAAAVRHHPDRVDEIDRDLAASQLADYARHVAETAPPLADEQVDRIVALLRGGASR